MSLPFLTRPPRPVALEVEPLRTALDAWAVWNAEHGDKKVLTLAQLLSRPTPPDLVEDLLVDGTVATLVSVPGLGKSISAIDLGMSIATGRTTFLDRRIFIDRPEPVFYVIGEGAGRFNLRVKAWLQYHGVAGDDFPFHTQTEPLNLLNKDEVAKFTERMQEIRPKLLVLDTLSRCISGQDENSQAMMSEVIEVLYNLRSEISDSTTVLALHHMNASGTRERGSSVLRAGIDTQIHMRGPAAKKDDGTEADDDPEITTASNVVWLTTGGTIGKQKDLEQMTRPQKLIKQIIPLVDPRGRALVDRYGKPLTSVVLTTADQELRHRTIDYVRRHPSAPRTEVYSEIGGRQQTVRAILDDINYHPAA